MKLLFQPPNSSSCGQHCVAMIANKSIEEVIEVFGHKHCTNTRQIKNALDRFNYSTSPKLVRLKNETKLPPLCILKVKWKSKGSHWIVVEDNYVHDPIYGAFEYKKETFEYLEGRVTSFMEIRNNSHINNSGNFSGFM